MSHCPSKEQLQSFAAGQLSVEKVEAIGEHIASCEKCQGWLDGALKFSVSSASSVPGDTTSAATGWDAGVSQRLLESVRLRIRSEADSQQLPDIPGCDVRNLLGRGGMGSVYLAWQHGLEREIAVKVLPPNAVRKGNAQARFSREASALGRLNHPGIVTAFDFGECRGIHYLLMEYVDGCDLAKIIKTHGALSIADACEVIRQAALALQCAHENELVHRDLKPSNLMVTRSGAVKILDLGLAKLRNSSDTREKITDSFDLLGTIDYMAPEVADRQNFADIRSDIFSLGATLFELLAAKSPLEAAGNSTTMQKLTALSLHRLPSIREHRHDTPKALAAIIDRMLAQNPEHRFATPADVADAVAPYGEGHHLTELGQLPKRTVAPSAETHIETADGSTTISPVDQPAQSIGDGNTQSPRGARWLLAIPVIALLTILTASATYWDRQPNAKHQPIAVVPTDHSELTNSDVPELTPEMVQSQRKFAESFVSDGHLLKVAVDGKRMPPHKHYRSIRDFPKKPFTVVEVYYSESEATDDELVELANAKLTNLESIKFYNEPLVTAAGLYAVAKEYPRLKHLSITGLARPYKRLGLPPEQLLPVVKEFHELEGTRILLARETDAQAWCRGLSQMESLQQIAFLKRPLGESLSHLGNLPKLEEMELYHLPLPDKDVQYLTHLHNLRILRLRGVRKISPAGLNQLKELSSLEKIKISKAHPRDPKLLGSVTIDDLRAFARAVPGIAIEVEENGTWTAIANDESLEDEIIADSSLR